jgi:glycosyltransferase involved in cell wall biosynthesis
MRFSVITPNFNGARYLEQTIQSILAQKNGINVELEFIVVDGGSTDGSLEIIDRYRNEISHCLVEADTGPANAINKGLRLASGEVIAWLNADDLYFPQTLSRVAAAFAEAPGAAMCFGGCAITDEQGREIRSAISRFKELFFPFSSRFVFQCINYLSQPALFFHKSAVEQAGLLREDMVAAWDYEYILRLWHSGNTVRVTGSPLASFRWHEQSISGQNFQVQFAEEYLAARADAGPISLQTSLHFFVRWGIVGIYSLMAGQRQKKRAA